MRRRLRHRLADDRSTAILCNGVLRICDIMVQIPTKENSGNRRNHMFRRIMRVSETSTLMVVTVLGTSGCLLDEFLLAAAAQNLRKLAKLTPMLAQPLPA